MFAMHFLSIRRRQRRLDVAAGVADALV